MASVRGGAAATVTIDAPRSRVEWVAQFPSSSTVVAVSGGNVIRGDSDSATRVPLEERGLDFRL